MTRSVGSRIVAGSILMFCAGALAMPQEGPVPEPPIAERQDGAVGAENAPAAEEMTTQLDGAVNRGLAALAQMQNSDGSFGRGRYGLHVGIAAICALAFMADGHLPGRGRYGTNVRKALDFVLDGATETGLLAAETSHGPMYGHGFATLFLGEIYGMNPSDERVRDALGRAVRLIVDSQNEEGGWRYNPVPLDADVSVTICEIMALQVQGGTFRGLGVPALGRPREGPCMALLAAFERDLRGS